MASIVKRFYLYQKQRFPVAVLVLSLLPAVLSSGAVASLHPSKLQAAAALIAGILYIFHIRIIDEHRDFEHDNAYHSTRPIQTGIISKNELKKMDTLALAIFAGIAIFFGKYSTALGATMLTYSYLAGKEFFAGEKIRKHYFFYNSINLVQMFLMQIFIYTIFAGAIALSGLIATHFIFTSVGTIIFEFARKLKIPGDDGIGKDTYTWYMGFNKALSFYVFLLCLDGFLFFRIANMLTPHTTALLLFVVSLSIIAALFAFVHWIKKSRLTDQLMQLLFLIIYGVFNISIYYLRLH